MITILSVFLSLLFTFLYTFTFYLFSSTPVSESSYLELLLILTGIISFSAVSTLVISPVIILSNHLLSFFNIERIWLTKLLVSLILFFGLLLVAENWAYTIFESSLKTNNSVALKLALISIASLLTFSFLGIIIYSAKWISQAFPVLTPVLLIFCTLPGFWVISDSLPTLASFKNIENTIAPNQLDNIIIISGDGINAKDMGIYGNERNTTPFLTSKAAEFAVFEHAFSNNRQTTGSILSMLTGMSPITTHVVYPPDILKGHLSVKSLPNILGSEGYFRSNWAVPHFSDADSQNMQNAFDIDNGKQATFLHKTLNHLNLTGVPQWFFIHSLSDLTAVALDAFFIKEMQNPFDQVDTKLTENKRKSIRFTDEFRLEMVLKDISTHAHTPFFINIHFMGTHGPKFHSKQRVYSKSLKQDELWDVDFYHDSILEFDSRVKKIYRLLETLEILENTLIVVTSDHGQRYNNTLRVPIIFRFPEHLHAGHYEINAQRLDIAPTIISAIGLKVPAWMEGSDLSKPNLIPKDRLIVGASLLGPTELVKGLGRVRKEPNYNNFRSINRYYVIRCDMMNGTKFPIKFGKTKRINGDKCNTSAADSFISDSTLLLENLLNNR